MLDYRFTDTFVNIRLLEYSEALKGHCVIVSITTSDFLPRPTHTHTHTHTQTCVRNGYLSSTIDVKVIGSEL